MKMECQFQCCSCRIAENQSKAYVYDNSYAAQMEAIKASVPALTPPASDNGDDAMEIDEDSGNGRTTRGTKRGPGGFSFGNSGRR